MSFRRPSYSFDIPVTSDRDDHFSVGTFPRMGRRESDLERRQREWESEVERFRADFFKDTPFRDSLFQDPSFTLFKNTEKCGDHSSVADVEKSPVPPPESFAVEFDLKGYDGGDISVRTVGDELSIRALHEVVQGGSKFLNEFNKTVPLPRHVDPSKLVSSFSRDGVLTVHMPAPPSYRSVQDGDSSETSDQSELNSIWP